MDLQERLEVQVGDLLTILRAQELRELGVGDDAALKVGVEAAVLADIRRHELGHIRLRALRLRGETHEGGQLVRDGAELEEGVVRAASLVGRALLRRHRRGVLAHAALGVAGRALQCLGGLRRLRDQGAHASSHLSVQRLQGILDRRQDNIGTASLDGERSGGGDGGGGGNRGRRRGSNRHIDDGLGGGRLLGGSLRGSGGLGGSRHLVCINGGL